MEERAMSIEQLFEKFIVVSRPPAGSINIRIGNIVEGPGGKWIPCASVTKDGAYFPCVYEVGPGRRQVCAANSPTSCADEALCRATELAATAAG
jgi:hypothetical protein